MVDTRSTRRSAHVPARVPGGAPSKAPKKTQATAMQAPTIASDAPTSQGAPTGQGAPANDAPITRRRRGDALPPVVGQELTGPRGALSFAAARAGGEQTFVIRSTEARSMGLPEEVDEALQKLIKKKNSGVRELATAEIGGGGIFSPQRIVSAKGADIKRVLALAGANVEITPLKDLLKPSPAQGAADTLGAQLQDVSLGKRLSALSGLQQLAKSGGLAGLDDATKDAIAKGAYAMAQPLIDLFNATLLETTRPRREAIIKAHQAAGTTQPGIFNTYLTASAEAMRELRAAGSTPELAALGAQVSSIADVLAGLESRQGLALLAALLPHGDGALIGQVRHQPKLVLGLVDQMVTSLGERLAATRELLETPRNQRPQDLRGTSASGGYDLLPGGLRSESARRFSAADPFSGVNTAPLTFLGTDHAPAVRVAVRDALLGADRALPALIAAQEKQHLAEEYQRYQPLIDGAPAAQRAELEASARQQIAENFQPMNAQTDVVDLVRGLSTLAIRNEDVFSSTSAAAETLGLLREVLSGVQTPQMHRLIADAALGALENARKDPALAADAGVRDAADALRSAVQVAGPDPAVRMAAAVRLLDGGDYGALPAAIAALSAKDPELRDAAALAVVRVARAARIATADPADAARLRPSGAPGAEWEKSWDSVRDLGNHVALTGDAKQAALLLSTLKRDALAPLNALLTDRSVRPYTQTEALRGAALLEGPDGAAAAAAHELLKLGAQTGSVLYPWQREHAALVLAEQGSSKTARAAKPELDRWAAVGARAQAVLTAIDAARAAAGPGADYVPSSDPAVVAAARLVLEDAREKSGAVAMMLAFLDSPNPVDLRTVPSYSRSRYPSLYDALHGLAKLGETAKAASALVR